LQEVKGLGQEKIRRLIEMFAIAAPKKRDGEPDEGLQA
jgi:hypothetical protein